MSNSERAKCAERIERTEQVYFDGRAPSVRVAVGDLADRTICTLDSGVHNHHIALPPELCAVLDACPTGMFLWTGTQLVITAAPLDSAVSEEIDRGGGIDGANLY